MNAIVVWLRANALTWATVAWDWIKWAGLAVWASCVAVIKSPAAWLACGCLFVVGFSLGHASRHDEVAALRKARVGLEAEKADVTRQLVASQKKLRETTELVEKLSAPPASPAPVVTPPATKTKRNRTTPGAATPLSAPAVVRNPFGG